MKMARTLRILSSTLACLVFLGLVAVSTSRGSSNGDVCKSSDSHCFVDKFSTLRLSRVEPIKVGHVRKVELEPGKHYQMKTLALQPPIYEIPDFLSAEECDHIISLAEKQGLKNSSTVGDSLEKDIESLGSNSKEEFVYWDMDNSSMIDLDEMLKGLELNVDFTPERNHVLQMYSETGIDKNNDGLISLEEFLHRNKTEIAIFVRRVKTVLPHTRSRYSSQAWLDNTGDPIMNNIQRRVQKLTQLPMELIQASEYLQVVSYSHKGHYNCHLDSDFPQRDKECCHILDTDKSNCRICRYLTVLYFLNDVEEGGETAFPVADNTTFDEKVWIRDEESLCNLAKNCHKANVVAKPIKGKAIMWYNHLTDERTQWMGGLDHLSFHGGCDVIKGRKWIANNWISVSNNRKQDIWNWIDLAPEESVQQIKTGEDQSRPWKNEEL